MRRVCVVLLMSTLIAMLAGVVFAQSTLPPVPQPIVIEGSIAAITMTTPTSGKVTVQPARTSSSAGNVLITFLVNANTKIYKDGTEAKLEALAVTDSCRANLVKTPEGSLLAQVIYAKTVVPVRKMARGTITEKKVYSPWGRTFKLVIPAVGSGPTVLMWFSVGNTTRILVDGRIAGYDQLAQGQTAEVSYAPPPPSMNPVEMPILAVTVSAKNPPPPPITHLVGKLLKVDTDAGLIVVLPTNAASVDPARSAITFKVNNETKIDKFGPAALSALVPASSDYPGDTVDVTARIPAVTSVIGIPVALAIVVQPQGFSGVVDGTILDPNAVTGTLLMRRGPSGAESVTIPFKVVKDTIVLRNRIRVPLGKLVPGDVANIKYFQFHDSKVAALVEATAVTRVTPPTSVR